MLRDMNGNPVSITKTDTDIINVYATVFIHYNPDGYDNGTVKIMASERNSILARYLSGVSISTNEKITLFSATSGTVADMPNKNTDKYASGSTAISYDVTNRKIMLQATRLPVGSYNLTEGIKSIIFGHQETNISSGSSPTTYYFVCGDLSVQVGGSWFPGSNVVGEAVATGDGATTDFATRFPFVSNATIYVDGVAAGNVTVDENLPLSSGAMGQYFELIPDLSSKLASVPEVDANTMERAVGVYYNPFYSYGITSFTVERSYADVSVSDDLETWVTLSEKKQGTFAVPAEYQNYKYWKIYQNSRGNAHVHAFTTENIQAANIHFSAPPAEGAIITADYFTKVVAKDENHVFDLTVTIQLGEFNPDA